MGFFTLLPFDLTVEDLGAHADALVTSIVGAVTEQQVPHVVMLSSGGADLAEGTGPITGLYLLERALLASGVILVALRSGHVLEKVGDVLESARAGGVYPVCATSADITIPMVATRDIREIAAQALLSRPASSESVDLIGPAYSERAVAQRLGAALGREIHVAVIPEEAWVEAFIDAGFRPHIAGSLAELHRADERGSLAPRGDRSIHVTTGLAATISQ
ncbi:Rossmann-fold NAD(P)-binding domain-containing protein [Gulosibacter sp. ACHW.36C]|uniref:Uncharacterized protein n=1 Tax=Gulosibacter sediminis TaxID=1729695 RepID=A0ABY4MW16_9MICO|nr:hypothetical protein [Gulosibacter sediminis]UQN14239.1 hypothetical protein M3M28_09280 [Gulosibacter sediminis]